MNKPEFATPAARQIVPARNLTAKVAATLKASGRDFVSKPVDAIELTYDGVAGDFHAGLTRPSGGREPWYERGTEMRNERQVSILSVEELAEIAGNMGLTRLEPGWIGANLVLEGIPSMTFLPARTLLFFPSGATLRIDGHNGPCRIAGGSIAEQVGAKPVMVDGQADFTRTDLALAFVTAAKMKRGLVAWVERQGIVRAGDEVKIRVWEHWVY
jgi:hypothetical protein